MKIGYRISLNGKGFDVSGLLSDIKEVIDINDKLLSRCFSIVLHDLHFDEHILKHSDKSMVDKNAEQYLKFIKQKD
jgi:hypothetical protein